MDCQDEKTCAQRTRRIRELNDRLRTTGKGGKFYMTRAVADLPSQTTAALLLELEQFNDFTRNNDPWGEHDFGSVSVDGVAYFWKIDAYDLNLEFGSPDPADDAMTQRVLTLMTADDL